MMGRCGFLSLFSYTTRCRALTACLQPPSVCALKKSEFGDFMKKREFSNNSAPSFRDGDFLLSSDQLQLRESVKKFAEKYVAPHADSADAKGCFPMELWPLMGEFGLLGPTAPPEFGGLGLGYLEHVLIMEQLSRYSAGIALSYGAHSNLCVNQIVRWGTEEQKQRYLPKLLDGTNVGALAMSETESGSDVVSMLTKAVPLTAEGNFDGFLLKGSKMWITNGPIADVFIIYAKTDSNAPPSKGITAFIIEKGMEGFQQGKKLDKLGMRSSDTSELLFEGCRVSKSQVLGEINKGVRVLMSGLDSERLVLSAGPIGIMQACFDLVLPYVNTRKQFGQPIGDFQLLQAKLADMHTTISLHRSYLYSLSNAYNSGLANRMDCAGAILTCAEKATMMSLDAIQMLGGNGYTNEFPAGRFLRDAKLYEIGAGTSEIRRMLIGRELNERYRRENV